MTTLVLNKQIKQAKASATCEVFLTNQYFSHPSKDGWVIQIRSDKAIFSGIPKDKVVEIEGTYREDSLGFAPQLIISDVLVAATSGSEKVQEWIDHTIMNDNGVLLGAHENMLREYLLGRYAKTKSEVLEINKLKIETTLEPFEPRLPSKSLVMQRIEEEGRYLGKEDYAYTRKILRSALKVLRATASNTVVIQSRVILRDDNNERDVPFTAISFMNCDTNRLVVVWVRRHIND